MAPVCINHTEHRANNNHRVNVPSLRRALVNRDYAQLWYGQAVSPVRDLPIGLWLVAVYLVVFVLNAAGQFFNPARFATTGDVVHGEEDRIRAAGLAEATTSAAAIAGPPIAVLLLVTVGFQWALAANAASYVVSYLAIRFLRLSPGPRSPAPAAPAEARNSSLYAEF